MLICNDEPDIILLTEVIPKAQKLPISPALLHVPGFSMYANFSPSTPNLGSSGTRGVCIYVANHLSASEVSINASAVEHTWVRLSLKGSNCLLIGCIYCSPSNRLEDSVHQLRLLFQQAISISSHVVMVGGETLTFYRLTGVLKHHRLQTLTAPTPFWKQSRTISSFNM